jgi:hypothetical protein
MRVNFAAFSHPFGTNSTDSSNIIGQLPGWGQCAARDGATVIPGEAGVAYVDIL